MQLIDSSLVLNDFPNQPFLQLLSSQIPHSLLSSSCWIKTSHFYVLNLLECKITHILVTSSENKNHLGFCWKSFKWKILWDFPEKIFFDSTKKHFIFFQLLFLIEYQNFSTVSNRDVYKVLIRPQFWKLILPVKVLTFHWNLNPNLYLDENNKIFVFFIKMYFTITKQKKKIISKQKILHF